MGARDGLRSFKEPRMAAEAARRDGPARRGKSRRVVVVKPVGPPTVTMTEARPGRRGGIVRRVGSARGRGPKTGNKLIRVPTRALPTWSREGGGGSPFMGSISTALRAAAWKWGETQ